MDYEHVDFLMNWVKLHCFQPDFTGVQCVGVACSNLVRSRYALVCTLLLPCKNPSYTQSIWVALWASWNACVAMQQASGL